MDEGAAEGAREPRKVQSQVIAEALEEDIVAGRLKAGDRLDEASLAARFNTSRTPVREALQGLCGRSLAERIAYRGVVVTNISTNRIDAMFAAMAEVETICARLAALHMTLSERAEIEVVHAGMGAIAASGDFAAYDRENSRFHGLILNGCHNQDLFDAANLIRVRLAPFRRYQLRTTERLKRSNEEHQKIVEAMLEGDARSIETAIRRHLASAAHEAIGRRRAELGSQRSSSKLEV